jgi:putative membrane protein
MFKDIISTNESILKQLEGLPSTIDDDALAQLSNSVTDLKAQIQAVRKTLASTQQTIQTQLDDAKRMFNQISDICEHLSEALSDLRIDTNKFVESFSNTLEDVQELLDWSNDELAKIQKAGNSKIDPRTKDIVNMIDVLRTRLTDLNQAINDNNGVVTVLNDIQDTAFRANSSIGTILNRMNDKALQNVQDNLSSGSLLLGDINDVLGNSKGAIDDLSDFSDDVVATGQTTLDRLEDVKKKVPKLQSAVTKINSKVHELDNKVSYEDLSKLLSSNVDQESAYFSSPVDLTTHDVFVSENYGKGLAPFYSVLALWVGGMFLTALLKTKVGKTDGPYTPREEYFGKYMLFGSMAVAQGIVTALGDLFILKIPVDSPVLFVILAGFCSLIFSMILYSLVATLSNVGKAVGVIFMLLQITASGGTFPIQVTPIFFRAIYSYMPFTYAINGFREAIYGVNFNHLTKDIVVLIIFGFIFTTYGRVFKKPLNKLFEPFSQNLKKSGVIH